MTSHSGTADGTAGGDVVAITGAQGFIGRHVTAELAARGQRLRLLVRRMSPMPALPAGTELVVGDLDDPAALRRLVRGAAAVVHLAGAIKARRAADFMHINCVGTANLGEACRSEAPATPLLVLSSLAAREPRLSPYAASKRRAEEVLEEAGAPRTLFIRAPAIYGPGDRETLSVFRLAKHGLVPIAGRGHGRLSLMHVHDLARAIAESLVRATSPGIYEIDDGVTEGYSQTDIARLAGEALGRRVRLLPMPRCAMLLVARAAQAVAFVTGRSAILTPGKVNEMWHPDWVTHDRRLAGYLALAPCIDARSGFRQTAAWYVASKWL